MFKEDSILNASFTRYAHIQQRTPSSKVMLRVYEIYGAGDGDERIIVLDNYDSWEDALHTAHILTGVTPEGVDPY